MELRKAEPEAFTAGAFQRATGYSHQKAAELRMELEKWGLIVSQETQSSNKIPYLRITLTPEGRKAADHFLAAEAEALKGKARKEEEEDSS